MGQNGGYYDDNDMGYIWVYVEYATYSGVYICTWVCIQRSIDTVNYT